MSELCVATSRWGVSDVSCTFLECTLLWRSGVEVSTSVLVLHFLIKVSAEDS